ncbi:MAG: hypothetical protein H0T17_05115 [Propionibacteriales bacterium]|nr:hypothetical protein [Propionibacteriales bacterium]
MSLDAARAVADAVLYEGYLLYPYRSTSGKNQVRWQFGVLGPQGAEAAGTGEAAGMSMQCLLRVPDGVDTAMLRIHVRFLQVQRRRPQSAIDEGFTDVPELTVGTTRWVAWDEAVEVEHSVQASLTELQAGASTAIDVPAGEDVEDLAEDTGALSGRVVRQRWPVRATISARVDRDDNARDLWRLSINVDNIGSDGGVGKDDAVRRSLVGTHVLVETLKPETGFVSVIDPPDDARSAAAGCQQSRCWPVLAGPEGDDSLVLGSPIILYDHPEIADESVGALFDSTEIDEILTLRVMTMTDQEKAEARATDPRAAEIIDRCDQMSPEELQRLHGVLRDPFGATPDPFVAVDPTTDALAVDPFATVSAHDPFTAADPFDVTSDPPAEDDPFAADKPWWDPESEATVDPEVDFVLVQGVRVAKGSIVRLHPNRRADAQDLFFADQVARVTAVHRDVDGETHVAVVLVDDPAADMHEWYGRYLYFAPDEVEPVSTKYNTETREESRP